MKVKDHTNFKKMLRQSTIRAKDKPSKASARLPSTIHQKIAINKSMKETNMPKIAKISDQVLSQEGEL
jgi:hypothetical protein